MSNKSKRNSKNISIISNKKITQSFDNEKSCFSKQFKSNLQ